MIFHRAILKSSDTNIPVILSNSILEQVTFIKFLGVIIDNKQTFERHIVCFKNKISKRLGIIPKERNYLNRETLLKYANMLIDKALSSDKPNGYWFEADWLHVNVMRSPVIERLMVRGSQVALKHVIHDMEARTLVMELRRRAIKRCVPVVTWIAG